MLRLHKRAIKSLVASLTVQRRKSLELPPYFKTNVGGRTDRSVFSISKHSTF